MLPQYQRLDKTESVPTVKIPFGKFAVIIVLLPFISFIFCVLWSIIFYFERSTATHCRVFNILPSISAAIGNYQPQRFIWQAAIVLHEIPRFMIAYTYYEYYSTVIRKNRRNIAYFAIILNVIELTALLGLSLYTSIDRYEIHKTCFGIFIGASEFYMLIAYLLNANCRKEILNDVETKSVKYKRNLFIINIISFILAGYSFVRHNKFCEPGVYTVFAFFEYIVVFTNMGYHMTAYWDFSNRHVYFDWQYGIYLSAV